MASNMGGQRGNLSSASGRKGRSATSTSHKGSRVEPSHVNEKSGDDRKRAAERKDAAAKTRKTAKRK